MSGMNYMMLGIGILIGGTVFCGIFVWLLYKKKKYIREELYELYL